MRRFIRGYTVTNDNDDAPRSMLVQREEAGRVRGSAAADAPVRIQLREHAEPRGQLPSQKHERLLLGDVPPRERPILRAGCAHWEVSTSDEKLENMRRAPTALSRFLSHMSLIVQPAPRMTSAPRPNRLMYVSGAVYGSSSA